MAGPRCKIIEVLEATTGGTRRHVLDLLYHLDRERFDLELICSPERDPAGVAADVAELRAGGIPVTIVPMHRRPAPWADTSALVTLNHLFRRTRPDLVHAHSSKAGFLGRLAARHAGVKATVYTPHCFAFAMHTSRLQRQLYLGLEKLALRWTSRLVCVCPEERDDALQAGLPAGSRAVVIGNGVPTTRPSPAAGEIRHWREKLGLAAGTRVIGAVGRLSHQKGYACLLTALATVLSLHPDTRLVIIGEGEQRRELEQRCRCLRIDQAVCFVGNVADTWPLYGLFDLFVQPSLWEALPYGLLDAMSAGLPIVASRVGGIPGALAQGQAGLLVAPGNAQALATALAELLTTADKAQRLGTQAQAIARQHYRLDTMIQKTETLYASLATHQP